MALFLAVLSCLYIYICVLWNEQPFATYSYDRKPGGHIRVGSIGSMFGRNGQTFDGFDLLCSVGVWVFMGVGDMAQAHTFHFLTPGTVMLELCLVR